MAFNLVARLKLEDKFSAGMRKAAGESDKMKRAMDSVTKSTDKMSKAVTSVGEISRRSIGLTRDANGRLRDEFGKFVKDSEHGGESFRKSMSKMTISTGPLRKAIGGILGAVTSLKGAIIASGAVYAGIIRPLKLASDAEQANIAFTTMLGSAAKAKTFLTDLSNFANKTPFELPALRDASKRLLAFGFASKEVMPLMTGIGNAASGLGLGADGIDRITLALGQMKAKGRMQGDEAMALTEAGIPVWDILAKKMKLTTAQVIKLSEKGLIPADKAINVLVKGMNDRFPAMMDKQSKSLAGLYSTIKDTFSSKILTEWGNGLAAGIEPKLDQLVTWINNNGDAISRWGKHLQDVATVGSQWIADKFDGAFKYVKGLIDDPKFSKLPFGEKINVVLDDMKTKFDTWFNTKGKDMITSAAEGIASTMRTVFGSQDNIEKMAEIGVTLGKSILTGIGKGLKEDALPSFKFEKPAWMKDPHYLIPFYSVFGKKEKEEEAEREYNGPPSKYPHSGSRGKFAGGLDRVPYNRFPAILHKDERVQTKAEADSYRSGRGGGNNVYVTVNQTVHKNADVEYVMAAMVKQLRTVGAL